MTQIDLSRPVGSKKVRHGFGRWRTVFLYKCSHGHEVSVFCNAYRGKTPVPGTGAITCPQCEFKQKYGWDFSDFAEGEQQCSHQDSKTT